MKTIVMKSVLAACVWASVWPTCCVCFSRGASTASCSDMKPGHISAQPQHTHIPSAVTIHTSRTVYLPQHMLTVSVRSSRAFMGLLLQARSVVEDRVIGGEFTLHPAGTHTLSCLSPADTITHSDKLLKRNLSFTWRAPAQPSGDLRFYITVVHSYFIYWTRIRSAVVHDGSHRPQASGYDSSIQTKIFSASLMKSTDPHKHTSPRRDSLNNAQYSDSTTTTNKVPTRTLPTQSEHTAHLSMTHSGAATQPHPDGPYSTSNPCNTTTASCAINTIRNRITDTLPHTSLSAQPSSTPHDQPATQTSRPQTHLRNRTPTDLHTEGHLREHTPPFKHLHTHTSDKHPLSTKHSGLHTLLDRNPQDTQPHTEIHTFSLFYLSPPSPTPLSPPPDSPSPTPPSVSEQVSVSYTSSTHSKTLPTYRTASLHQHNETISDAHSTTSKNHTLSPVTLHRHTIPKVTTKSEAHIQRQTPPTPTSSLTTHTHTVTTTRALKTHTHSNFTVLTLITPTCTPAPNLLYTSTPPPSLHPVTPHIHTARNVTTQTPPTVAPLLATHTQTTTTTRTPKTHAFLGRSSTPAPYNTTHNTHSTNSITPTLTTPTYMALLRPSTLLPFLHPDPSPALRLSLSEPPAKPERDSPPQRPREPGRVPEGDVAKPERVSRSELGLLLGLAAGVGMGAAAALRYLQRKHCGKHTAVSLGERSHQDAGIIHVQECGDLVQVRRIRENSFLLLQAEYNLITAPGS